VSRHNPIAPEIVATIRSSPEGGSALARRLGISRQTVAKIRAGQIHSSAPKTTSEELIRQVLAQPPDVSLVEIAKLTGLSKDVVRRIRLGLRFKDVAPDLPRMTLEESQRRCYDCVQWEGPIGPGGADRYGRCHLGIPEATESQTWARGCGAYAPAAGTP
jgi:transcriptional regulator with XRE-family HTH domain